MNRASSPPAETSSASRTDSEWTALAWDSEKFGFPVGRVNGSVPLPAALAAARHAGCELVYCSVAPEHEIAPDLLSQFGGSLVDRKVTFRNDALPEHSPNQATDPHIQIKDWPRGPAGERLLELSREAGWLSRFRVDPRMPRGLCDSLYETWIERSARREIADLLLVAIPTGEAAPVGMITGSFREGICHIGLVSVAASQRGRGLGGQLMRSLQAAARNAGVSRAEVVTQLDNQAACRCYSREHYHIARIEFVYHFWLQTAQQRLPAAA